MTDEVFMREAIALSEEALRDEAGGPFGAVVVRDGKVLGRGRNRVLERGDPTAHGEIEAIRDAARALRTHELAGCTIYASCEPCPMCAGAIQWARIDRCVYAATRDDAAAVGFADARFHARVAPTPTQALTASREPASQVIRRWAAKPG